MRIVIDLQASQTIGSRNRGIGRYALNFARSFAKVAGRNWDVRIALNAAFADVAADIREALRPVLPASAFSLYHVPQGAYPPPAEGDAAQEIAGAIAKLHYSSLEPQAVITASMFEGFYGPDLCPPLVDLQGVVSAAILYDLTPLRLAERYLKEGPYPAFYRRQLDRLARQDVLLAISEASRRDAVEMLGLHPRRVVNISGDVSPHVRLMPRQLPLKTLTRPYVLFGGGEDLHKNLDVVLAGFGRLPPHVRGAYQLVHVGPLSAEAVKRLRAAGERSGLCGDALVFLGYVSDETLIAAYDHAELFVFPSLYEGFGLPPLEAMVRGTPALVSRSSSLQEVVDHDLLMFDPLDAEDVRRRLEHILTDAGHRISASRHAQARNALFSWEGTAQVALRAIASEIERRTGVEKRRRPPEFTVSSALGRCAAVLASRPTTGSPSNDEVVDAVMASARFGDESGPPRLLIDVTCTDETRLHTGIQRVVRRINQAAQELKAEGSFQRDVLPVKMSADGRLVVADEFVHGRHSTRGERPLAIRGGDTLLMLDSTWSRFNEFRPHFETIRAAGGSVVTAVYDLVPLLHPDVVAGGMPEVFLGWLRQALLESDGLLCISRSVADELTDYLERHVLPMRDGLWTGWWHLGADFLPAENASGSIRPALERVLGSSAPTYLMVGTLEPRKRHHIALEAMDTLWAEGSSAQLVLLGKQGWNVDKLAARLHGHGERGRRLFWFESVSDAEIAASYRRASTLIFPSIYEGFGLPIVEAARAGLPVVAADIPVLREVGGSGVAYFSPDDPAALAEVLRRAAAGRLTFEPEKVVTTSWKESASSLLDVVFADRWHARLRS